ncbi:transglutaminase N-terminal domain-containing protein [Marinibaculum pumilum]|uniref:Transglutaminase N-terminal domain-containing protein n=1 Tax=Marinibaculum pumilum TaxID=1766165 RepID=A0ABV7L717_9PROT
MRYRVSHRTDYRYADPVDLAYHLVHLRPLDGPWQKVFWTDLRCDPEPAERHADVDHFGNALERVLLDRPHQRFTVLADSEVEVVAQEVPETPDWEAVRDVLAAAAIGRDSSVPHSVCELLGDSAFAPSDPALADYAAPSFLAGRPILEAALDLTRRINDDFAYDPTATDIATPVQQVMRERRGVCQDFAHVQIGALRSLGLAARYVSGYLRTYPPPGQPRLRGADASHAWISVWCGPAGWVDMDPTNALLVAEDHIVLAHGRDFDDVSPVRGVLFGGGSHDLAVSVDVIPAEEEDGAPVAMAAVPAGPG